MKKYSLARLLLVFLLALLPVTILRDFTPSNELRYLSIADEALREGHWFAFTHQGEPYADKPPLYLWIVMLGKSLFGRHCMWFLALFSLLPAFGILRAMDRWTREALGDRDRTTSALVLMTSGLFLGLAVFVRMDMLMCLFITLALRSFWRCYTGVGNPKRERVLFPFYTWLALFTKGPVGLLVPILSVVVFLVVQRQPGQIDRYCGWRTWGIIGAGCAVWFTLAWIEGGADYLNNLLFHQTLDRAVDAFHHKEPVWYYLATVWYSLAPWSLLAIGTLAAALVRRIRLTALERFFLTIVLTTLVMLSLFSSKLAVYLAPAFPFIIYLAAMLLYRMPVAGWMKAAVAIPTAVWTAALPALLLLRHHTEYMFLDNVWCMAAAGVLSVSGMATLLLLWRRRELHASVNTAAAGLLLAVFIGSMALPELNVRLGYGTLCQEAGQFIRANGAANCYVWKIRRAESMDAYLGQPVVEATAEGLCSGAYVDGILLLPADKLRKDARMQQFVADKRQHAVGEYLIVELPAAP